MGTALTNISPATTFDTLLKTNLEGPLTTTITQICDGAGNDSPLYLATDKIGFNEAVDMTKTSTQLNATVDFKESITASAAELNILDGVTRTATQLNFVDATSSIQTQLDAKLASATAASTYLTQANAASTYLTIANASSTYQPLDADLTTLAGLTATTDNFIVSVASAWASRTPAQVKTTLSLNLVENTALSTWAGTSNITTLGTIATGTWNATTIGVSKGGTGLTALGTGLQVLRTNAGATAMEWATISAGGGDLLASNNLSDLVSASTARTNLGLAIGTNVQAYSSNLTSFATVTPSANGLSFVSAANYAAMVTLLGLTIGTNTQAYSANLTTYASIAPSANVQTLLGAANYAAFKTSLSLNNVENTALSTWAGSSSITTLGTVTTGTLSTGAVIAGVTMTLGTDATGDIYYRNSGGVLTRLAAGTNGHVLTLSGGLPSWAAGGGGGGGDMTTAVYDPATIAEQLVGLTATQTLSNKTLTAAKIANGGFLADANGNEILEFETVGSAVNHLKIVNNITNEDPFIEVAGGDVNVGMYIVTKGNGFFALDSTANAAAGASRGQYAVDLQLFRSTNTNVSSGNYSFSANYQNTASGSGSVALGNSTQATGQMSMATGQNTIASAQESFAGGFRSRAALRGAFGWSSGMHSTGGNTGDNQYTLLCARRYITGVTTGQTGITLYIGDGTSTEIVPDVTSLTYRTWTVKVRWNVVVSASTATGISAGDTIGAEDTIVLKKTGSTVTVVESTLGTVLGDTALKTGASMGYTASGTNFRINLVAPTFASGNMTIKAHATLHISENGY